MFADICYVLLVNVKPFFRLADKIRQGLKNANLLKNMHKKASITKLSNPKGRHGFNMIPFQDFTLDMYFRQFWQDPRLSFERRPGLDKLVVGAEYIKLIWVPDTFFVNEKTAYFHDATTDNQFVRIFHTGDILRSIR